MTVTPEGQAIALIGAFFVGLALGLLYDLIRPFRLRAPFWGELFLDFVYWLIVTLVVFICAPLLSDGYVRFVMIATHFFGAFCYFKLLSSPIRWLTTLVDRILGRILSLLLWPFRTLKGLVEIPVRKFGDHLKKTAKKIFSFPVRWFTIRKIPKEATHAERQPSGNEVGQRDQNQKGWSSD